MDIIHLPFAGGVQEQPNLWWTASDIIKSVRSQHYSDKMDKANKEVEKKPNED